MLYSGSTDNTDLTSDPSELPEPKPKKETLDLITKNNLTLDKVYDNYRSYTMNHKTSGWYILGYNKKENKLEQICIRDAENILKRNIIPLIVIDLWEHAYYLDYKSTKINYIKNVWSYLNWDIINERIKNINLLTD